MSGIADVARAAGVSKSTVSRALSGSGYVSVATRVRVETAATELGFVASSNAASLVTGRTKNVGLVIPFLNRWYFAEVLVGIEGALMDAGYDLSLYRLRDSEQHRRRVFDYFLMRKRVDAVISVGIALSTTEVALLRNLGKPIVGIGGAIPGIPTISIDDVGSSRLATEHLLQLGHTQIVHLGGSLDRQMDFTVHAKRLEGFQAAMSGAGPDARAAFHPTEYSMEGGYAAALRVLADPLTRPTAIAAGCDEIAFGAIIAARQLGIAVPSALSVIGIDGHDHADMFGLTTLRQDPAVQGAHAVELVMRQLLSPAEPVAPVHTLVEVQLDVRASTTAPPR